MQWVALVYAFAFMLVIGALLALSMPNAFTRQLSADVGTEITPQFFAFICFLGAGYSPLLALHWFQRIKANWQRSIYLFTAFGLLIYVFPYGYFLFFSSSGNLISGLFALLLMGLFASFGVIGLAVYR